MTSSYVDSLRKINIRCSDFLDTQVPLYKVLSWDAYGTFSRIKVRQRKEPSFGVQLNTLVGAEISTKFVDATTVQPQITETQSMYYVFPVDGYRFVWSPSAANVVESLREGSAINQVRASNLSLAAQARRDLLLYGIADYYVIHTDAAPDYSLLLEAITSSSFAPTPTLDL